MIPRPRQRIFVDNAHAALKEHNNTLGIAVTGFGKTAAMGFLSARYKGKQLHIAHRDELVAQNAVTFAAINQKRSIGYVDGRRKDCRKNTTFAMVQSLAANHDLIPSNCNLIALDEAHHYTSQAKQWKGVVDVALDKSPDAHLLGVTATPRRGMDCFFNNVADHVSIREMMSVGLLAPLRSYACVDEKTKNKLDAIGRVSNTGDQEDVAKVLDNENILDEVFREWQGRAGDRRTVVFCSSVEHSDNVADYFASRGVSAASIHGGMAKSERRRILSDFRKGHIQVLTNVFVLTEGWDDPGCSCAILLRQSSDLGPIVQMVGRILRTHPGKSDAILFDFGTSILKHGTLEQNAELLPEIEGEPGLGQTKFCPEMLGDTYKYRFPDCNGKKGCGAELPANTRTCPFCGFVFDRVGHSHGQVAVELTEVDLLNASPFRYVDLFNDGNWLMASGFGVWALVGYYNGQWHAIGGRAKTVDRLHYGDKMQVLAAADDFLRVYSTEKETKKGAFWQTEQATRAQVQQLQRFGYRLTMGIMGCNEMNKYEAACHLNLRWNSSKIKRSLEK